MFSPLVAKSIHPAAAQDQPRGLAPLRAAGHALPGLLQCQLKVGSVDDPLETEADAMAARAMGDAGAGRIVPHTAMHGLQRKCACSDSEEKCAGCKEEEKGTIHRKSVSHEKAASVPSIVHSVINAHGCPLDTATRAFMEPRFGFDFGRVRIHTDSQAAQSASAVKALAYTVNNSIAFSAGSYAPYTAAGRRLLAHELAHVVQQGSALPLPHDKLTVGHVNDAAEADADRSADAVLSGHNPELSRPRLSSASVVRRTPAPDETSIPKVPQELDESLTKILKLNFEGRTVHVRITRSFKQCPCSRVDDTRSGWFYNPDLNKLAIDYRACKGSTSFDAFIRSATDTQGGGVPTGDVRAGIDVSVSGENVKGRLVVEGVGENKNTGAGVGGHAKVVFKAGSFQLNLDPTFIRELANQAPGTNPNQLEVKLGAGLGSHVVEISAQDLLGNRQFSVNVPIELDQPINQKCFLCFCPAPVKKFTCTKTLINQPDEPPQTPTETPQRKLEEHTNEYRYYFAWDSDSKPSEESYLQGESAANMDAMRKDLAKPEYPGYKVTAISGYASPEGLERTVNRSLALRRAKKLAQIVREAATHSTWHGPDSLPEPQGLSELLGKNPEAPSAHLRDVIATSGKHSAEELTAFLTGSEIMPAQMTSEFLDLFKRTTSNEWMQLFGLGVDSPLRPNVEDAVHSFIDSDGKGSRPWERVFRPLRFAAATLKGTEMVSVPNKSAPDKSAPSKKETLAEGKPVEVSEESCKLFGAKAEEDGLFGPEIDPAKLKASSTVVLSENSCPKPAASDRKEGCDYEIPKEAKAKKSPEAPDFAPKPL